MRKIFFYLFSFKVIKQFREFWDTKFMSLSVDLIVFEIYYGVFVYDKLDARY